MSRKAANPTPKQSPPSAQVYHYAEHISFDANDELRTGRLPVMFRLFSVGRGLGPKLDISFGSDYAIYYDSDDSYIISVLQQACPQVNWYHNKVYHRWLDQSRIQILNSETGALIGQIETRRYMGRKVNPESVRAGAYGANVHNLTDLRAARAAAAELSTQIEEPLQS